jgi:hypothetical protein
VPISDTQAERILLPISRNRIAPNNSDTGALDTPLLAKMVDFVKDILGQEVQRRVFVFEEERFLIWVCVCKGDEEQQREYCRAKHLD